MIELVYVLIVTKKDGNKEIHRYINENDFQCACKWFESKGYEIETEFEWQ